MIPLARRFLAVEVEDFRAVHHGNVDAIANENITAHDRSPMERLRGKGCAYWPGIAKPIVRLFRLSAPEDFRAAPGGVVKQVLLRLASLGL